MSSIREVAKLANVSPATVSRVINGTANVDREKTERVRQVISETGFVPNETARTLFKKSARMLGLILPSIQNPFFTELAAVIDQVVASRGYRLFLYNTGSDFEKELSAFQALLSLNADGIILTSCHEKMREYIQNSRVPVVILDSRLDFDVGDAYIHCDFYQGGRLAVEHLFDCGCRNIVCIRGPQDISSAVARYEGYRDFCWEHDIREQIIECAYDFSAGLRATEQLLAWYPDVDGILACNDIVAFSAYKILHKRGIRVPEQVQLIGFDDIYLARLMTPELTTVAQSIHELGTRAAEFIIDRQAGHTDKATQFVFPAKLIIRETTKRKENAH